MGNIESVLCGIAIFFIYIGLIGLTDSHQDPEIAELLDKTTDSVVIKTINTLEGNAKEITNKSFDLPKLELVKDNKKQLCPPKPETIVLDSTKRKIDTEYKEPIQVKVPTVASTGSSLSIEGSGFIPDEQVRVELVVDWISHSPEFQGKKLTLCKLIAASEFGNFTTTLNLPKTPIPTNGQGKYSIIGMESKQEQIRLASFKSVGIGFSYRQ